jgi:LmbE family N-acetylglucosaminyl deacetylase
MTALSRRTFGRISTTATVTALGIGALTSADTSSPDQFEDDDEVPVATRLAGRAAFLQVVAHPDDDLYFLNPDVSDAVRTGAEVTTVVVTSAEADGVNGSGPSGLAAYVAARQHGLRSAYAVMAGLETDAPWRREKLPTRGGSADLHILTDAPRVRLVFLNVSMGAYTGKPDDPNHTQLAALWAGRSAVRPTLLPPGSTMSAATSYTREQLIGTLADLLALFTPTVIRTLDPDPERRGPEPTARAWYSDGGMRTDNEDHTATARFTYAALARHRETPQGAKTLVESYVGYGNARWPHNLGRNLKREKLSLISVYGWADHRVCGEPSGCGDLNVGDRGSTPGWMQSTNLRHPGTTGWLRLGRDRRLAAYAVVGGRVLRWTESGPATGRFGPPTAVGGSALTSHLSVAEDGSGRVHLAGLRVDAEAAPHGAFHEIVVAADDGHGRFGTWTSLGAPKGAHTRKASGLGGPVLAVDGRGVHHLFVRNGDKTVSWSSRDPADAQGWADWVDVGGWHVRDGLATAVTAAGDVELYANGNELWHWQPGSDGVPRPEKLGLPGSGDSLTVTPLRNGRFAMTTRVADTGELSRRVRSGARSAWTAPETRLGSTGGFGAVAAHPHEDGLFLAQRGTCGLVEVLWQPHAGSARRVQRWLSGPAMIHRPALASDAAGNIVVAVVGPDAALYTARVTPDDEALSLSWT